MAYQTAANVASKLMRLDKTFFQKLGASSELAEALSAGLFGGSVVSNFFKEQDTESIIAPIPTVTGPSTSKPNQARGGRQWNTGRRYTNKQFSNRKCRCPRHRYSSTSRYRK